MVNATEDNHRYNMKNVNSMPKFGSGRPAQPLVPLGGSAICGEPEGAPSAVAEAPVEPQVTLPETAVQREVVLPLVAPAGLPAAGLAPAEAPRGASAGQRGFWAGALGWMRPSGWDLRKFFTGRPARRSAAGPVQRELFTLEQIKPMRNDLSDSDLEIMTPRGVSVQTPLFCPTVRPRPTPAWQRWTRRLVGVGRP